MLAIGNTLLVSILTATIVAAQTAPQYGQCGGTNWTGPTLCPSGWTCTVSNPYYYQCLPGTAPPVTTPPVSTTPGNGGGGGTATPTTTAAGGSNTLVPGNSFIRAVEAPNFHKYLQAETLNTPGDAVLGEPSNAAQFQITGGQLIQVSGPTKLYATVEARASASVVKLKVSWQTTPSTDGGKFVFSGDTVEWSSPNVTRPQNNAWLICPDAQGHLDLFVNLGPYSYMTPAGCADETIHAYTGPTATA